MAGDGQQEDDMSLKSLILGGIALFGATLSVVPAMTTDAEAKTRVVIGVGGGYDPFYDPYFDDCNYRAVGLRCRYYDGSYYRYRPYYYRPAPRFNFEGSDRCATAAKAISRGGYRSVKALDCRGRYFKYQATRRGKVYLFNVDTRTGRISRAK
jgi:hypothetical protein